MDKLLHIEQLGGGDLSLALTRSGRDLFEAGVFTDEPAKAVWDHLLEGESDYHYVDQTQVGYEFDGPMIAQGTWYDKEDGTGRELDYWKIWAALGYVHLDLTRHLVRNECIILDRVYAVNITIEQELTAAPLTVEPKVIDAVRKLSVAGALNYLIAAHEFTKGALDNPAATPEAIRAHSVALCAALDAYFKAKEQ